MFLCLNSSNILSQQALSWAPFCIALYMGDIDVRSITKEDAYAGHTRKRSTLAERSLENPLFLLLA